MMYVSIKPSWFITTGRIEKHYYNEKGKFVKEFFASTKKWEDADKIVELLNKKEGNDSTRLYL